MTKIISILVSLCYTIIFPYSLFAIENKFSDANIFGHVIDKRTNEHLPYINIVIKGTTIGTATDHSGHFFLKDIPTGEITLEVTSLGYSTLTKKIQISKNQSIEVNFEIEENQIALENVVISANPIMETRKASPSLINVLDIKSFESTNSVNLSQGLNFQPGVRVENNCQNCGYTQVRINGLDGPYTQILIDSRPVFSALSAVYGLEQIPANMIERVEIMRGGGSAITGAAAIAGSINIITKEPINNSAQISHNLTSIGNWDAVDNNTTVNASLVTDNHKGGIYVFGQSRIRNHYDHDGDRFSELPELKNNTFGFRSFVKTGNYSKISLEYHNMQEFRRGGNMFNRPPHEADIAEQVESSINGGGLKFDMFSPDSRQRFTLYTSAQYIMRNSYYGGGQDPNAYGETTNITLLGGAQYSYKFNQCLFMPAELTTGAEYTSDNIEDDMWGYDRYIKQDVRTFGAFAQNEWKNDMWGFLIGARMDKHNMLKNPIFSPRANLRFNPYENLNIRATYTAGFRAPQAFDEDLHIENVGGTVSMIEIDPNLKEEKSNSFSLSADMYKQFRGLSTNILIEGFYTRLNDVFIIDDLGYRDEILIKQRRNGEGAKVYGLTVEGKMAYKDKFDLQVGATIQKSLYDEEEVWSDEVEAERRMFRTPNLYGYFTANYTPVRPVTLSLSGTYTGDMLVQHRAGAGNIPVDMNVETPDFFDINFKAVYKFKLYRGIEMDICAGIQNIFNAYQSDFDKGENRDSGYIYGPATPRSYFAGIKLSF